MKSIALTLTLALLGQLSMAQHVIERHFASYLNQEHVAEVHVSSKMFELVSSLELESEEVDMEEIQAFLSSIRSLDMLIRNQVEQPRPAYEAAIRKVAPEMDELMTVQEDNGSFSFYIDEQNGVVKELAMIGAADQEVIILSLTGSMALRQLTSLSRFIQTRGFDEVSRLESSGLGEVKLYPNPATAGSSITVEVPTEWVGGQAVLYGLQGEVLRRQPLSSIQQSLSTQGLPAGRYLLELTHDQVRVKQRLILR